MLNLKFPQCSSNRFILITGDGASMHLSWALPVLDRTWDPPKKHERVYIKIKTNKSVMHVRVHQYQDQNFISLYINKINKIYPRLGRVKGVDPHGEGNSLRKEMEQQLNLIFFIYLNLNLLASLWDKKHVWICYIMEKL